MHGINERQKRNAFIVSKLCSFVDFYQKELNIILDILKENSKGMTVTDISHKMKTNRNSVAKYLDILLILGHVQLLTFGPAKVFFPSKRIPVKSLMNFTSDCMILFDENLTITNINQNLLKLLNITKETIQGESLTRATLPPLTDETTIVHIKNALEGKSSETQIKTQQNHNYQQMTIKHIPTAFDDGKPGVACIITDTTQITQLKKDNHLLTQEIKSTLTNIQDMLFIINNTYTIKRISNTLMDILNLPEQEIIGKKCYQIMHGTDKPPEYCPYINNTTSQTQHQTYYEPHLNKNLEITITPINDDQGTLIGSVNIIKVIE
jgi:PAS domain S-box-containing protein